MSSSSFSYRGRAEAIAIDADTAAQRYAPREAEPAKGRGLLGKLVATGFWGTLVTLIVSAATAPGFLVFALLPLAGLPYLLFCFIAWTGDRNVE